MASKLLGCTRVLDSEERIGQVGGEIEVVTNRCLPLLDRGLVLCGLTAGATGHGVVNDGGIPEALLRLLKVLHPDRLRSSTRFRIAGRVGRQVEKLSAHYRMTFRRIDVIPFVPNQWFFRSQPCGALEQNTAATIRRLRVELEAPSDAWVTDQGTTAKQS